MLTEDLRSKLSGRVVFVGVGNSDRGDDGVGPLVAELLTEAGAGDVIDAQSSPELETWRIREKAPECVVFIDAVHFGGSPGDVGLLEASELRSSGFDTHRAPLRLTMQYLESELGCKCYLLAIQPRDVRLGSVMCDDVKGTAARVGAILAEVAGVAKE